MKCIQFKVLQRKLKFRNPNHWTQIPEDIRFDREAMRDASLYLDQLRESNISFTYPGDENYPVAFLKMKEPPLFLEYRGLPLWKKHLFLAVVGSREVSALTEAWLRLHLPPFLLSAAGGVVSGGARGVDQWAHLVALKVNRPTIFVLPSGLDEIYPPNLRSFLVGENPQACFISEFEKNQKIHKSHFYFRNRLISALGEVTLVAQASLKSGSLLTVHHSLENGKAVGVVPGHPQLTGFDGNLKLLRDGAFPVATDQDLLEFWNAEIHMK